MKTLTVVCVYILFITLRVQYLFRADQSTVDYWSEGSGGKASDNPTCCLRHSVLVTSDWLKHIFYNFDTGDWLKRGSS